MARKNAQVTPITEAKPKKKKWLLRIMIVLVMLAGGGGAAWYAMEESSRAPKTGVPEGKASAFVPLEPFTVNLQPEHGDQYLQVGVVLKVTEPDTVNAIKLHMPEVRSRILLLLSGKKASEISTVPGKLRLSTEIMNEARQPIGPQNVQQGIISVLFTSFVIQ